MSQLPSLSQLRDPNAFLRRHLGPDAAEQQAMLDSLGIGSRVELIEQTVPPGIRLNRALDLPPHSTKKPRWPGCAVMPGKTRSGPA